MDERLKPLHEAVSRFIQHSPEFIGDGGMAERVGQEMVKLDDILTAEKGEPVLNFETTIEIKIWTNKELDQKWKEFIKEEIEDFLMDAEGPMPVDVFFSLSPPNQGRP